MASVHCAADGTSEFLNIIMIGLIHQWQPFAILCARDAATWQWIAILRVGAEPFSGELYDVSLV